MIVPSAKDLCHEARDKTPSAKDLCREARDKAPLGANSKVILASLEGKTLHSEAKLAFKGRAKTVVSPCEATLSGEAILASPIAKKIAICKAKPKASQPKGASFQSPRVSVLDQLGPVNTDSRDYLSIKRKLLSEKSVHISPS